MTVARRLAVYARSVSTCCRSIVFVPIGRRSHDERPALGGMLETAAPFVIGLGVGWLIVRAWRSPMAIVTGLVIWPMTIVVGMIVPQHDLRPRHGRRVRDRGHVFLGLCLVGWRAALRAAHAAAVRTRRRRPARRSTSRVGEADAGSPSHTYLAPITSPTRRRSSGSSTTRARPVRGLALDPHRHLADRRRG